jgi:hypothetical protein
MDRTFSGLALVLMLCRADSCFQMATAIPILPATTRRNSSQ